MSNTANLLASNEIGLHSELPAHKETLQGNWSFGPINVQLELVPDDMQIRYTVRLMGLEIGHGSLDAGKASASVGANTPLSKANLTLTADFTNREVRVAGQVCVMVLFSGWKCTSFDSKIFSF